MVASPRAIPASLETLEHVEQRVLWIATSIVHYANKLRTTASGLKVGGHQASSASAVSIMSALYFAHLRAGDQVSVKPHASPVLHAINYLLGRLDRSYLTELRAYHGLQSYPSRTKDPDPVDYSTGSVGIGATATIWSSLAHRYAIDHGLSSTRGRHIAVIGDAELDEGAIWEAVVEPTTARLGDILWIVDVNRQSLDRVVPDIAVRRLEAMFQAAGWHATDVKYGRRLEHLFGQRGGDALRSRMDAMSNTEYQHLLRSPAAKLRRQLPGSGIEAVAIARLLNELDDREVTAAVADLGGHDLAKLIDAFGVADQHHDRPSVIFAYTIKGWGLPIQGHPENHSALISSMQWEQLAIELGASTTDPWAAFEPNSPEQQICEAAAKRLETPVVVRTPPPAVPVELARSHVGLESTQQAFGRALRDIARSAPEVAQRIVTVSPDVASSTSLGAWINEVGVWSADERPDWFSDDRDTITHWHESGKGQHIELGIAEGNTVGLIAELGTTWSRDGQPLLPIGTMYDPFVNRALEPWSFGIYAGGQSILVGTPSGVTLAPEGGAHQSIITPSVGLEQPGCVAFEPAFGQDLEWILLEALSRLGRTGGSSSYLRLSTRALNQELACLPADDRLRAERRSHVVAGGYVLSRSSSDPALSLIGVGAIMPEVIDAFHELSSLGIACDVLCITSADLIFRAWQARQGLDDGRDEILDVLFPKERRAPIVAVLDGHPHTLAFLGAIQSVAIASLGVNDFGQVGDIDDLYRLFGIDVETIVGASLDLLE